MNGTLPENFGIFPEGARLVPDPRFVYLTPEQRLRWLKAGPSGLFEVPENVRRVPDIPYGPHPKHRLDLYLPPEADLPVPVIFYIHGGAWTVGERDGAYISCCFPCVYSGFAIISADYRLLPETGYPQDLDDVCAAVAWARENAALYGLDTGRFGMIGDSAGAYLTLMCALTRPECNIRAACSQFGPTTLLPDEEDEMYLASGVTRQSPPTVPSLYSTLFGDDSRSTLSALSPINLIGPDMPPLLLQHGTLDAIFPCQMAPRFVERAKSLYPDCRAEYRLYDGFTHSDPRFLTAGPQLDVLSFFKKHLAP